MRGGARRLRPAVAVSIVAIVLALAGCGAAALPPPPPPGTATAVGAATPVLVASPTAQATQAATPAGNAAQLAAGKAAFTTTCGSCHMLSAAGTSGTIGPSLNGIGALRDAAWIAVQIQNPCAPGHANAAGPKYTCTLMPPGIATGAQAEAIAAYLASQK